MADTPFPELFSVLDAVIRPDYRETVARCVLAHSKESGSAACRALHSVIRKGVTLDGFRYADKAPTFQLVEPLARLLNRVNCLWEVVLPVWLEAQSKLETAVRGFLEAKGVGVADGRLGHGFHRTWHLEEALELADAFVSQHPDCSLDDVALMICCVTGQAPITPELANGLNHDLPSQSDSGTSSSGGVQWVQPWGDWLRQLEALPADASAWDQVPAFVHALQELAREKLGALEGSREVLRQALAGLSTVADELQYFDLTSALEWSAEARTSAEAGASLEQLEALQACLEKHRAVRAEPPATRDQEQARREEMDRLASEIAELYEGLARVFGPRCAPEPGSPDDGSPQTALKETSMEEGALSDLRAAAGMPGDDVEMMHPDRLPPRDVAEATAVDVAGSGITSREGELAAQHSEEVRDGGARQEPVREAVEPLTPAQGQVDEVTVERPEPSEVSGTFVSGEEPAATPLEPLSPEQAACLVQASPSSDAWDTFMLALVSDDDLAGAYWLARSLAATGSLPLAPDWLLAAVQAGRWLRADSDQMVFDLLEMAKSHRPENDGPQAMFALAAALRPALIAPVSGMLAWLIVPDSCPRLHVLVTAVSEFANLGLPLRPEDLLGVAGAEQREARVADVAREAGRWLEEAPARRPKYKRAADVWHELVGARGEIREMLLPVAADSRSEVDSVRDAVAEWEDLGRIQAVIDDIHLAKMGRKGRRIVGAARQHLIRGIDDACAKARRWCELVEHEKDVARRGDWLFAQVARLREAVERALPEAEAELAEIAGRMPEAAMTAGTLCLQRAVLQLRGTLNLPLGDSRAREEGQWSWLPLETHGLQSALNRRLLWLPEIALTDEGSPAEGILPTVTGALVVACTERRSLERAFALWLEKQDYRFADTLLEAVQKEAPASEFARHYQEALAGSVAALLENKHRTVAAVEQAVLDGIVAEEERARYLDIVESVREDEVLDFPSRYALLQAVRTELAAARDKRLEELQARWETIRPQLTDSGMDQGPQGQVATVVEAALEQGDTRIVDEHLARLTEALDTGTELGVMGFSRAPTRDPLREFADAAEAIAKWLDHGPGQRGVVEDILQGRTSAGIAFGSVPKPRLVQAAQTTKQWWRLKKQGPGSPDALQHIRAILSYLDFTFPPGDARPLALEQSGMGWIHVRASMSASDLAKPIPQFGSQAHGRYDVVCLWERPGADSTAARLRELHLTAHAVLVLYLGRLSSRQRRDMLRMTRERQMAMALLDEILLVYLAQERDTRLPVFLRCALPYAAVNPYTPFQAGDVPPEMFFGREGMARELQRSAGSCLVYGGRQLGKSALLRHVQRQYHYPERRQYAWIENMKLVFDPEAGKGDDNVWRTLRDRFKREGLLSSQVRTDRREQIIRRLRQAMQENTDTRVLAMFDEADDFLDADAAKGFRTVIEMRELMADTGRRFKVVFAGLHHVQRFQGIPNQPLAHFGAPLCVGPLEPVAAEQLVRQPLEALGFRFGEDDDATVLRVLSYTNYHPGLIQLFCQELLQALQTRTAGALPPYSINQADVEAVYRHPEVRDRIRERFDWTLALDTRYQAIAWSLIVDQMARRDSYARAYPPGEILSQVREWWPAGFSGVSIDQLRGLLDEMCGLGVLVRNADGHFRLRSPNLVRLMGTETDIENRLLEIAGREPARVASADSHHAALDDEARRYSPFTYAQERALNPPRSGVSLIFASQAAGAEDLPKALRQFVAEDPDRTRVWREAPSWASTGETLARWLDGQVHSHSGAECIVFCHRPTLDEPQEMAELVRHALDFCQRHRSRAPRVRVFLVFDSTATWVWLGLPEDVRDKIEDSADAAVWPTQWTEAGLQRRLSQHDKLFSRQAYRQVLEATGGWHMLVDTLFEHCAEKNDPRPSAVQIERDLNDPRSHLCIRFEAALGLDVDPAVRRVLAFLLNEEATADLVVPDLVGGEPPLQPDDCRRSVEYLTRMSILGPRDDVLIVDQAVQRMAKRT